VKTIVVAAVVTFAAITAGRAPAQVPSQASSPAAAQELPPIRNFLQVTPLRLSKKPGRSASTMRRTSKRLRDSTSRVTNG